AMLWMFVFGIPVLVLTTPWLWFDTGPRLLDLVSTWLAPSTPTLGDGVAASAPHGAAVRFSIWAAQSTIVALGLLGLVASGGRVPRRGEAAPPPARGLMPPVTREGALRDLGILAIVGLVFVLAAPAIAPTTFPPRIALGFPFLAILAGYG